MPEVARVPAGLGAMSTVVRVTLFLQRPVGGPIDFDVELGGSKVSGQIHREDPEFEAAERAIETHEPKWTMAGPVPPTLELSLERVTELASRRWT